MKKLSILVSGELYFVMFIFSGYIKGGFTFIPIDLTMLMLGISVLIAMKRFLLKPVLQPSVVLAVSLLLIFASYVSFTYIYSSSEAYALNKTFRFFLITGWSFMGVLLLVRDQAALKRMLDSFILLALFMTGFGLVSFLTSFHSGLYVGQINVLGSDYLALGRTCGIGAIMLIGLYLYNTSVDAKRKFISGILTILIIICLIISGARMPLLALLLTLGLLFVLSLRMKGRLITLDKRLKSLGVMFLVLLVLAVPLASAGAFDTVIYRFSRLTEDPNGGKSAAGRIDRYATAIAMWSEHPVVGEGVGSFPIQYNGLDTTGYPHNIFLEILSETGIVGLILFLALLLAALHRLFVDSIKLKIWLNSAHLCVLLGFTYMFMNANVSGDLNENRVFFSFMALCFSLIEASGIDGGMNKGDYINVTKETLA
ncbi:O-antigen ligase family protein [Paenibacillus sp. SI8]|uniref:O-antigen ligase family protein n=1 Tax=unclassified Paenibacillus TaxID=185978 RepID=UPI003466341D